MDVRAELPNIPWSFPGTEYFWQLHVDLGRLYRKSEQIPKDDLVCMEEERKKSHEKDPPLNIVAGLSLHTTECDFELELSEQTPHLLTTSQGPRYNST